MANVLIKQDNVDLTTNSRVKAVTLYFNKAQVIRTRSVQLQPGENLVEFLNLGDRIEESSIKTVLSSSKASLLSTSLVSNQLFFFKAAADEATYHAIIDTLRELIALLDKKSTRAMENHILLDLQDYIRQALNAILLEQEIPLGRLKKSLELLEEKLITNKHLIIDLTEQSARLVEKLELLKAELQQIRRLDRRVQNNIEISLLTTEALSLELELSYLLPGACWRTVYDAKLETDAAQVEISYFGEVKQETGEDWNEAPLLLSTMETRESTVIPEIYPLLLRGYEQKRDRTLQVERTDAKGGEGLEAEEPQAGQAEPLPQPQPTTQLAESTKHGTAYSFRVADPYTIPADGRWHRVLIRRQKLEAQLLYETTPESLEYVYLKGKLINTTGLPLLAGEIALYRNGSYMGKSQLEYSAPDQPFALSFGIDEDLKVRREIHSQYHKKLKSLTKNERFWHLRFILYNYKKGPTKVVLREAAYLSRLKEIAVEILPTTSPGYSQSEEGILNWELELPPDSFKHTRVELDYRVTGPKSFNLDDL